MILGIVGAIGSGKDSVGKILIEEMGYQRIAFGDRVRELLRAIDPIIPWVYPEPQLDVAGRIIIGPSYVRLSDVLPPENDSESWTEIKENKEVRSLLQRVGTEGVREVLYQNAWVDATFKNLNPTKCYVVPDTRFPNEVDAIRSREGKILKVLRPDIGPSKHSHASESYVDKINPDYNIVNNGTLEDLRPKVIEIGLRETL